MLSKEEISKVYEEFQKVFKEKLKKNFEKCLDKAVEEELLLRLNNVVRDTEKIVNKKELLEKICEMENPELESIIKENDPEILKVKLEDMINDVFL